MAQDRVRCQQTEPIELVDLLSRSRIGSFGGVKDEGRPSASRTRRVGGPGIAEPERVTPRVTLEDADREAPTEQGEKTLR